VLSGIGPAVTVFGSARTRPGHPDYELVRQVGAQLGRAGYAVITGGGVTIATSPGEVARIVDAARARSLAESRDAHSGRA
jgi:predicted Rossmann-fold nucleotide-binding protein